MSLLGRRRTVKESRDRGLSLGEQIAADISEELDLRNSPWYPGNEGTANTPPTPPGNLYEEHQERRDQIVRARELAFRGPADAFDVMMREAALTTIRNKQRGGRLASFHTGPRGLQGPARTVLG